MDAGRGKGDSLIILNFHGVGAISRQIDAGEHHCWLERDAFEAVLDIAQKKPGIHFTVDDGNASDVEIILPALMARKLSATFFLCTGRLDTNGFISRQQLHELRAHGMTIGSHGVTHESWRTLPEPRLWEEVAGSRAALEEVAQATIDLAACPFGAYDRRVLQTLRRAGYTSIYTSDGGTAREHHWLKPRTTITRSTTLADVERLVWHGPGITRQLRIRLRTLVKRYR